MRKIPCWMFEDTLENLILFLLKIIIDIFCLCIKLFTYPPVINWYNNFHNLLFFGFRRHTYN
jgi:hypothetical protein